MINPRRFAHLRAHSYYSIGRGLSSPTEMCVQAQRLGHTHLALTDTNGTYGFIEFEEAAREHGIQPIFGVCIDHGAVVHPGGDRFPLVVLARNRAGLANVARLASLGAAAHAQGVGLSTEQLRDHHEGVSAFTAAITGEVAALVQEGDPERARAAAAALRAVYGDHLYIELQDHGIEQERALNHRLVKWMTAEGICPVLTHDVRCAHATAGFIDETLQGVLHPRGSGDFFTVDVTERDRGMPSPARMAEVGKAYPDALESVDRILDEVEGNVMSLVRAPTVSEHESAAHQELNKICRRIFAKRYRDSAPAVRERYRDITNNELDRIARAGLSDVFLFAHNIFSSIHRENIYLGPATGITLQSFCAHLLGITTYDPYRIDHLYRPYFPSTSNALPLELQIATGCRTDLLRVARSALGPDRVAYAPAVERITPIRAVRMVAPALKLDPDDTRELLRVLAYNPGMSLREVSEHDRRFTRVYNQKPRVREVVRYAVLLEGLPSGITKSRRSFVVAGEPLMGFLGSIVDANSDDVFAQVDREALPSASLFRVDVSAFGAVDVCRHVEERLEENRKVMFSWEHLVIEELGIWDDLQNGDTTGVFLFEGESVREHRLRFQLDSVESLTNFLALLRLHRDTTSLLERIQHFADASPLENEPAQIRRLLGPTHGHILYDEQLRDVVSVITGRGVEDAQLLLTRIKRGTPASLAKARSLFMRWAADNDAPYEMAEQWFDECVRQAPLTIRRERVLADALLVCKSTLFRRQYPGLFFEALLRTYGTDSRRGKKYIEELTKQGRWDDIDVNESDSLPTAEGGTVRAGFCNISGVDAHAADVILRHRGRTGYVTFDEFMKKVGLSHLQQPAVKEMVQRGAFDALDPDRSALLKQLRTRYRRPAKVARVEREGQMELPFDT